MRDTAAALLFRGVSHLCCLVAGLVWSGTAKHTTLTCSATGFGNGVIDITWSGVTDGLREGTHQSPAQHREHVAAKRIRQNQLRRATAVTASAALAPTPAGYTHECALFRALRLKSAGFWVHCRRRSKNVWSPVCRKCSSIKLAGAITACCRLGCELLQAAPSLTKSCCC